MTNAAIQDKDSSTPAGWGTPEREPLLSPDALEAWRTATRRTREIAIREGWTRAEVARRSDLPASTLTQFLDGNYAGNVLAQAAKLTKWLDAYEATRALSAKMPAVPGWVPTPTAEKIIKTIFFCQMLPDMGVITVGSGMGKTITAQYYCENKPSAYLVTMRPTTGSVSTMLHEVAQALDVPERNPVKLDRAIGDKLKRNGRHTVLIVDEAQNLVDRAIDQLRYLIDQYGCGLVLMGNNELYSRSGIGKPREGYGQIHRRVGPRLTQLKPTEKDIATLIRAWSIDDADVAQLLHVIGRKPGALGQIGKTMQGAAVLAASDGKPIDIGYVRAAWQNRGGEEVHS